MPQPLSQFFYDRIIKYLKQQPEDLSKIKSQWIEKFGDSEKSNADFLWSIYQEISLKLASGFANDENKKYEKLKEVYSEMIYFLSKHERNYNHVIKLKRFCDLMTAGNELLDIEVEIIPGWNCKAAMQREKIKLNMDEAIRMQVIPFADCGLFLGCQCDYAFIAKRDENGKLVRKNNQ